MPGWLPLALACGLYLWQAANYALLRNWNMAGVFVGYAIANVFFILDFVRR